MNNLTDDEIRNKYIQQHVQLDIETQNRHAVIAQECEAELERARKEREGIRILYECTQDRQGADFWIGYRLDADGWRTFMCAETENEEVIKKLNEYRDNELINYIGKTFGMTLKEVKY